ncbi:MAG TPA: hypothetical protein PKC91_04710 [Ignavibacteria bacterium]|nr:hypothetical protein [Ignavibacteria bacterium]
MEKPMSIFTLFLKNIQNKSVAVLLLLFVLIADAYAQIPSPPLQLGQSVVTCFDQTSDIVVRAYEIRKNRPAFVNSGTYWNAPLQNSGADWTNTRIGNVYGIALDDAAAPSIFVSRSTVFCSDAYTLRPDSGLVYKLNGVNWASSVYVKCRNIPGPPQANANWIPNTGPGLGNLCYDNFHKQIFVTNHEDGKIYRVKDNAGVGQVKSWFDPFSPDNLTSGFVQRGERLWGIGAYGKDAGSVRVYFSRWRFDNTQPNPPLQYNEIWSIAIDINGEFIPSSIRKEIDVPKLADSTLSQPVADIEFSFAGDMLLGERTMSGDMGPCGNGGGSFSHRSRIIEYKRNISGFYTTFIINYVGLLDPFISSCGPLQNTLGSNGGVDFAYGSYDSATNLNSLCDSVIIGTGDALFRPNCFPNLYQIVYGYQLSGRSDQGLFGDYVDLDGVLDGVEAKTSTGDVDVYRKDLCSDTSCIRIIRDTTYCNTAGTYVYEFQVFNNSPTKYIEQLEITVDSPQPPNYVVTSPSTINISPPVPPQSASGVYTVNLIGPGAIARAEVCFTISAQFQHDDCPWCCYIENCIKLPDCGSCAEILQDSIYCLDGNYFYNFKLKNGTIYNVTKIQLTSPGNTPITFVPQIFHFATPITPEQVFPNLNAQILGGAAGITIPVRIKLFSGNFECCYFELPYTLPPCDTFHLNLKTFIQGRYNETTNLMTGDTIDVELRNNFSPYELVDRSRGYLNDSGNCSLNFYNASDGTDYFIVLKHRNSVETWSKSPGQSFKNGYLDFDFLSYSQAFGENLKLIDSNPNSYGILTGDINQDGTVDVTDITLVYNSSKNFLPGYILEDLNGDNIADITDLMLVYNNSLTFISIIRP